jgi:N-methylhydantoinase A/oxoprolinase/acetone carboxylase beta subunit
VLLGVDVGGTFTDAVLLGREAVYTAKVPSTPADQSQGVMQALAAVLERAGVQASAVERLAHGMTVATNALLEGRAARTALLATEGFTDLVELGRQARAQLYELCAAGPQPLVPRELRFGVPERMTPAGVLQALSEASARTTVRQLTTVEPPLQAVAVVLLHSYAHPQHEQLLGSALTELLPGVHVSLSHELVGTFREYERAASTEVDAALSPLLSGYLSKLGRRVQAAGLCRPQIMQSAGGLMELADAQAHAALTVLSGPAGGVGGARLLARAAGEQDVLCFDMGGTSCDVCTIVGGEVAETAQREVAGRPLALPALDIHTVGAGGGSIAWRDAGGALRVGPHSAGAAPGPACYGRGGREPTVTDAHVLLGRLPAESPLAGDVALDVQAARTAVMGLASDLELEIMACAEGVVRVAEAQMAGALRRMTVERGVDPRDWVLMPFGGAGGLHAAALAREMGMRRVLFARASGVLSALGLAAAPPRRDAARTVLLSGEALNATSIRAERARLIERVLTELGVQAARIRVRYELRYKGQSFELSVDEPQSDQGIDVEVDVDVEALRESFEQAHAERYGYRDAGAAVELVTIRVSAWGAAPTVSLVAAAGSVASAESPASTARSGARATSAQPRQAIRRAIVDGSELEVQCLYGEPAPGTRLAGPMICALPEATLWIPPAWSGSVDAQGSVRLTHA